MSMILGLGILSARNIERVLDDPPLIWQLIAPDEPDLYEQARAETPGKPTSALPPPLQLSPAEGLALDLEKTWHGLHYLFTQTESGGDPPLNFLLAGGRAVGDLDIGYGPARTFSVAETRGILEALVALPDDVLQARYDPTAMSRAGIYPQIWSRSRDGDDSLDYLMEGLATLRGVLTAAEQANAGLVVFLT